MEIFKTIGNGIFNFFFPPRCIICRKALDEEGICDDCLKELPYIKSKIINPQFVSKTCAPLYYEDRVRASIIRYKFHGKTVYAKHYAKLMKEMIEKRIENRIDCIAWVPLSQKKLRTRGYDQAEVVARELATLMGIPAVRVLKKVRNNKVQHKLKTAAERRANVIGAYEVVKDADVLHKNVLIVDDILTTGSTLYECARILKVAGVAEVYATTIAKTSRNRKKRLKKAKNSL